MEINLLTLEEIITSLNSKAFVADITLNGLESFDLSQIEKLIIKAHKPEKVLIVYGTLAPGKPNHSKIEHIKGEWEKAIIKGKLINKGWGAELGYNGFASAGDEESITIEAYVLFSDELPANWQYIDDFEGNGYKRILTKYEMENGKIGIGYIYGINQDVY